MSRIVKSRAAVVEPAQMEPGAMGPAPVPRVIKRGFSAQNRQDISTDYRLLGPRDPYVEELNRLKIEIEQHRAELRRMRGRIDEGEVFIADYGDGEEETAAVQTGFDSDEEDAQAREAQRRRDEQAALAAREMEQKAYELVQQAEQSSKDIEGKAFQDAQQIRQQAQNEGYLEGFNKGFDEAQEEFRRENEPRAELLADLIEKLSEYEQERMRKNESELVELAIGIASKIVGRELRTDPKTVVKMLTEAVTQNHSEEYVRITLAEDLFPLDVKASEKVKKMLTDMGANVSVLVESAVPPGTIHVETPKGITDMSVETQLENIGGILRNQ